MHSIIVFLGFDVEVPDVIDILGVETDGVDDDGTDKVRVNIGCRSSVFEVSLSIFHGSDWDSAGGSSVSLSVGEGDCGGGFVLSGEPQFIFFSIDKEVVEVAFRELGHAVFLDVL